MSWFECKCAAASGKVQILFFFLPNDIVRRECPSSFLLMVATRGRRFNLKMFWKFNFLLCSDLYYSKGSTTRARNRFIEFADALFAFTSLLKNQILCSEEAVVLFRCTHLLLSALVFSLFYLCSVIHSLNIIIPFFSGAHIVSQCFNNITLQHQNVYFCAHDHHLYRPSSPQFSHQVTATSTAILST